MADPEPPDLTASNKDAVLEGLRAEALAGYRSLRAASKPPEKALSSTPNRV